MKQFLKNYKSIFFIGIGGASMSGLAILCKENGKSVLGSDCSQGEYIQKLKEHKIKVFNKHKASHIKNIDLVVYSGAINLLNPEIIESKKRGIKTVERSTFLGMIAKNYNYVIAISGTHGKTTTTALIGYMLFLAGKNPTLHIGGNFKQLGGNVFVGGRDYFVTEACEFRNSFLKLKPNVSVVTNLEAEHLDFFKTFEREILSFNKFVNNSKQKCFINQKASNLFIESEKINIFNNNKSFYARNCHFDLEKNKYCFDCYFQNDKYDNYTMNIFGKHNVDNAITAIAICDFLGIKKEVIKLAIETFQGVARRAEILGNKGTNIFIRDYAHHPTEINSIILAIKEVFRKDIICFFQPHTFSRTKTLISEFKTCFNDVEKLFILETFSARENFDKKGSAKYLMENIVKASNNMSDITCIVREEVRKIINKNRFKNKVILFLGAGDIGKIALESYRYKER